MHVWNINKYRLAWQPWQKQRYAGDGPYRVVTFPTGVAMIANPSGRLNVAHGRRGSGSVLLAGESFANYILSLGLLEAD